MLTYFEQILMDLLLRKKVYLVKQLREVFTEEYEQKRMFIEAQIKNDMQFFCPGIVGSGCEAV